MASPAAAAASAVTSASTTVNPLPLDAFPFLVAEVGGSEQTQYDLYALINAFVAGQISARSLVYRADLTGQQWLPIATSHPAITAALSIPYIPPPPAGSTAAAAAASWYYLDSQLQRAGPVTSDSLHTLHSSGAVTGSTPLWREGFARWIPFSETALAKAGSNSNSSADKQREVKESSADSGEDEAEAEEDATEQKSATEMSAATTKPKRNKKRKKPTTANTAIYATGLPTDLTLDEAIQFFKKAGVIREDIKTNEKRVRLYRDEVTGRGKGDATVTYMFSESVPLALTLLDGAEIRPGYAVTLAKAKFDTAAAATQQRERGGGGAEKRNKVETILARRQKEVALSWQGDDSTFHSPLPPAALTTTTRTSSVGLRIVVLSHLFTPAEAEEAADGDGSTDRFFEELTSDIGEELEAKCGAVEKMTVYEHNADGVVVVKFKSVDSAERCVREMRGRRFGGREIGVEWWDGRDYSVRETAEEEKARLERFAAALEDDEK